MSLRGFLKQTRLLLEQGLHESREAFRTVDPATLSGLSVCHLEERILMSAAPAAVVAAAPESAVDANEFLSAAATAVDADSASSFALTDEQLLDVVADGLLPTQTADGTDSADVVMNDVSADFALQQRPFCP